MSDKDIRGRYSALLRRYVRKQSEAELVAFAALGGEALSIGLPPEDIAEIHQSALSDLAAARPQSGLGAIVEATSAPLIEVLMSYGLAFREAAARREVVIETLKMAKEGAELANRAKSEFLANMSHELRTPLNAIIGFAELVQKDSSRAEDCREHVTEIHDAGLHLLKLVNDILDLSKIEAGKAELHEEPVCLPETLRSSLAMVRVRAEAGRLTLEQDVPRELPAIYADERMVKQILVNLLSNAVKFTPAGGTVTTRAWCHPLDGLFVEISDTGIGMAPEDLPRALARFAQLEGQLTRRYDGTGLGLPLSKSLAELHGGSLDLQSEVGAGTTVTVCFPSERVVGPREQGRGGETAATGT